MAGPLSSPAPRLSPRGFDVLGALRDANVGTPAYVYDLDAMQRAALAVVAAFGSRDGNVFYAVKANSAGPVVRAIAAAGSSEAATTRGCGADVVSGGELVLALRCGIDPDRIVYSGVAKSDDELDLAISSGARGIRAIQAESIEEIVRIAARARAAGRIARVALRVNPGVSFEELGTHAHVATGHDEAKFGIAKDDLPFALREIDSAEKNVALCGLSSHVGSQFFRIDPYVTAARILCGIAKDVRASRPLDFLDTGGGFGVDYTGQTPATPAADFVRATLDVMRREGQGDLALHVEPGRCLVAAHGVLVARVIQRKEARARREDRWLLIDAGMNDLIRPALYQAMHRVVALGAEDASSTSPWRVVGPVCESADDFGEHALPDSRFDHVALLDAGAYGYTMASRYNGRATPAEVFVSGGRVVASLASRPMAEWADERAAVR